jgi:hypothetical protein
MDQVAPKRLILASPRTPRSRLRNSGDLPHSVTAPPDSLTETAGRVGMSRLANTPAPRSSGAPPPDPALSGCGLRRFPVLQDRAPVTPSRDCGLDWAGAPRSNPHPTVLRSPDPAPRGGGPPGARDRGGAEARDRGGAGARGRGGAGARGRGGAGARGSMARVAGCPWVARGRAAVGGTSPGRAPGALAAPCSCGPPGLSDAREDVALVAGLPLATPGRAAIGVASRNRPQEEALPAVLPGPRSVLRASEVLGSAGGRGPGGRVLVGHTWSGGYRDGGAVAALGEGGHRVSSLRNCRR